MDRGYYLKYFTLEKEHWWFRARAEILRSYIEANCPASDNRLILNAGAATGGSIVWLSSLGKVTSLEYDSESVKFIREHLKEEVIEGSVLALPFADNSFDVVCAFDVIEHVQDDALAVRELARVCRPGGSVLITVPAHMHLWSHHDEVNHHYRRYSREEIFNLLSPLNGQNEFVSYFNYFLYFPIFLARKIGNFFSRKAGNKNAESDFEKFPSQWANSILYGILLGEKKRIVARKPFTTGVSILTHWKKG